MSKAFVFGFWSGPKSFVGNLTFKDTSMLTLYGLIWLTSNVPNSSIALRSRCILTFKNNNITGGKPKRIYNQPSEAYGEYLTKRQIDFFQIIDVLVNVVCVCV